MNVWMIRHWRISKTIGLGLIVPFFCFTFGFMWRLSRVSAIGVALLPFLGWQIYCQASAVEVFSRIVDFEEEIKIDWLRFILSVRNKVILYHMSFSPYAVWIWANHLIPRTEIPPEHFQIWQATSWPITTTVSPYELRNYLLPELKWRIVLPGLKTSERPANPISDDLMPYVHHIPDIPSLRYLGIAHRNNQNILIALLTKDASMEEFSLIFQVLDRIEESIQEDVN